MQQVYLATGRPGAGKTSLIRQALSELKVEAGGFYTREIREGGTRTGFKLVTLDGQEAVLAYAGMDSPHRVGKYGVDVASLETVGVPALSIAAAGDRLVVVDEIGKMELFSDKFRRAVAEIIDKGKRVLGTIMQSSHPWADALKQRPQVKLVTLTGENRRAVREDLHRWLKEGQ